MSLERFSRESSPMNKHNLALIEAVNRKMDDLTNNLLSGEIAVDDIPAITRERGNLLDLFQQIVDYNSVDFVTIDAYTGHVIVDDLPKFYCIVTNPRHMAYYDAKIKEELEASGDITVHKNERWWD